MTADRTIPQRVAVELTPAQRKVYFEGIEGLYAKLEAVCSGPYDKWQAAKRKARDECDVKALADADARWLELTEPAREKHWEAMEAVFHRALAN